LQSGVVKSIGGNTEYTHPVD